MMQEPGHGHLLLVAAGESGHRLDHILAPDPERLDPGPGCSRLPAGEHKARRPEPGEPGEGEVVGDREIESEPLPLAILAHHAHALGPAAGWRCHPLGRPHPHCAAADRIKSEDRPHQFRSSRPHEPRNPKHLAPTQHERGRVGEPPAGDSRERKQFLTWRPRRTGVEVGDPPAHHPLHDPVIGERGNCTAPHRGPVTEHRHPIGEGPHLFEDV